MKKTGLFLFLTFAFTQNSHTCDPETDECAQRVYAEWNNERDFWDVNYSNKPQTFELSNGLKLGIQIEEASDEEIQRAHHDLGGEANPIQGYNDKGGADRITPLSF